MQSDSHFYKIGLCQTQHIPQLFYKRCDGKLALVPAKMVDNIRVARIGDNAKNFKREYNKHFKFGIKAYALGKIQFFGIDTVQNDDMTISTDADDKQESWNEHQPAPIRRKQNNEQISDFGKSIFGSTNSSLGRTESAASSFCSFYASCLQQKNLHTKVYHFVEQQTIQQKL